VGSGEEVRNGIGTRVGEGSKCVGPIQAAATPEWGKGRSETRPVKYQSPTRYNNNKFPLSEGDLNILCSQTAKIWCRGGFVKLFSQCLGSLFINVGNNASRTRVVNQRSVRWPQAVRPLNLTHNAVLPISRSSTLSTGSRSRLTLNEGAARGLTARNSSAAALSHHACRDLLHFLLR